MTIQPSLVIWTFICFAALYLILKNLLFLPLLSLMDKRENKIRQAKEAKEEARRRVEEKSRLFASERERAEKELLAAREKEAEALRLEVKKQQEVMQSERVAVIEDCRLQNEKALEADLELASDFTDRAAAAFLSHLFES